MKIAVTASPLPGLRATEVCDVVRQAWCSVRPNDTLDTRPVCDGVAQPFADSGAADLLGLYEVEQITCNGPRRYAYRDGARVLLDYTALLGGQKRGESAQSYGKAATGVSQEPEKQGSAARSQPSLEQARSFIRSTAFLGEDLVWAIEHGATDITVVIPALGTQTDLGRQAFYLLSQCHDLAQENVGLKEISFFPKGQTQGTGEGEEVEEAGADERIGETGKSIETGKAIEIGEAEKYADTEESIYSFQDSSLTEEIKAARQYLSRAHITVLVEGEQRLLGLSGLAYTLSKHGLDPALAQTIEGINAREAGKIAAAVMKIGNEALFSHSFDARGLYAGAGGGLAFALAALGARIFPLRQANDLSLQGWAEGADMALCITGRVEEELPESIYAAVRNAQNVGIPVVLIYDAGGLRRGELARLGLNAAYEIRPERAFTFSEETLESASAVPDLLRKSVVSVVRTWGW